MGAPECAGKVPANRVRDPPWSKDVSSEQVSETESEAHSQPKTKAKNGKRNMGAILKDRGAIARASAEEVRSKSDLDKLIKKKHKIILGRPCQSCIKT